MARILLIDTNQFHANRLTAELQHHNHRVAAASPEEIRGDLTRILPQFDVVVVNVTADRQSAWDLLANICQGAAWLDSGPRVLAVSSVYRGPEARLRAERSGARLVYD